MCFVINSLSAYHLNGISRVIFWTNGTAPFLFIGNGSDPPVPFYQDIRAGAWTTTKNADELVVLLDVLADNDFVNDFFGDEEDDLILFAAACTFAKRNLNQMQGFFEQTIPTYSLDEFKAHFCMQRATSEIVTREIMATGNIPIGNPFGRHAIDPRKQILLFLWCMANQETTRLVADRFNVTFSSVTRVLHWVTKGLLAIRNQYIKWPNGNF